MRRAARSVTVTFSIESFQLVLCNCQLASLIVKCAGGVGQSVLRTAFVAVRALDAADRRPYRAREGPIHGMVAMAVVALCARAPYASDPARSRGRLHAEAPSATRSDFRRDCDRIIHSSAFRRLAHKTQVFVFHEGDHFRTRLTHTLEVAQIARSLARALGLDEDLAEALALAHDLGHTPFGHAGERALDRCLTGWGGFDHNAQTLRVVTALERRYAAFDGLNLSWETLEGLVKHNGPLTDRSGAAVGRYRERGVPHAIELYQQTMG